MKKILLIKYGEIALRGKNRAMFEYGLIDQIKSRISGTGEYIISREQGRFAIEKIDGDCDFDTIISRLRLMFGIVELCPCIKLDDQGIETLKSASLDYFRNYHFTESLITFKVETRRADKRYPLLSNEISAIVGEHILMNVPNVKVNVREPEIILRVELRNSAYIYISNMSGFAATQSFLPLASVKGSGGLPAGTAGKGVLLLSGGIDSPVAGYMMAKRGVELVAVYFHSPPFTSERARMKVEDLSKRLAEYTGRIKLYVVRFTELQTYLKDHTPPEKLTILLKRAMLRIGEKIAYIEDCLCVINGDSVGQVASQTLKSLLAVNSACGLPVIRPLAGMDKQEIVDIAVKIETYEISIRPFDDCCTLFVAKHPDIKPKASIIESIERGIHNELCPLIDEAICTAEIFIFTNR